MRGKIIDSLYNPGYDSWVLKQTKYGEFSGHAYLHEEDEDIDNSFDGCRIAEFRADLNAYKAKAKMMRQRAQGATILVNNLYDSLPEDIWEKCNRQIDYMEREARKATEYYQRMKDYEPIFIKNLLTKRREAKKLYEKKHSEE